LSLETPNLTAASIQGWLADTDAEIVALITKSSRVSNKRGVEDRLVQRIVAVRSPSFVQVYDRIRSAEWYVLSAMKADKLLRALLFDRVYALKIRGFVRQFRSAEVDMHFSLKGDLMPLRTALHILREEGQHKVTSLLSSGEV
jgi:hypothetical protein